MKNSLLEAAAEDIKRMRTLTQELVEGTNSHNTCDKPVDRKVACLTLSEDQSYFDSYAHFSIHLEMLSVSHSVLLAYAYKAAFALGILKVLRVYSNSDEIFRML